MTCDIMFQLYQVSFFIAISLNLLPSNSPLTIDTLNDTEHCHNYVNEFSSAYVKTFISDEYAQVTVLSETISRLLYNSDVESTSLMHFSKPLLSALLHTSTHVTTASIVLPHECLLKRNDTQCSITRPDLYITIKRKYKDSIITNWITNCTTETDSSATGQRPVEQISSFTKCSYIIEPDVRYKDVSEIDTGMKETWTSECSNRNLNTVIRSMVRIPLHIGENE